MPQYEECNDEWEGGTFYGEAISICISAFLQLLLLFHSLYHHWHRYRNVKNMSKRPVHIVLHITLLVSGLLFLISAIIYLIIDPLLQLLRHSFLCSAVVVLKRTFFPVFYPIYLGQILSRIHFVFQGSNMAISKSFVYSMTVSLIMSPIIFVIYYMVSADFCIMEWIADDMEDSVFYCSDIVSKEDNIVTYVQLSLVMLQNMLFGMMFVNKLRPIMRGCHEANKRGEFRFQMLIIKNTLLTVLGIISTIMALAMWGFGISIGLWIDVFLNSLVISLMFKYNEHHYKQLCRPCIWVCIMRMIRNQSKDYRQKSMEYLENPTEQGLQLHVVNSETASVNTPSSY